MKKFEVIVSGASDEANAFLSAYYNAGFRNGFLTAVGAATKGSIWAYTGFAIFNDFIEAGREILKLENEK